MNEPSTGYTCGEWLGWERGPKHALMISLYRLHRSLHPAFLSLAGIIVRLRLVPSVASMYGLVSQMPWPGIRPVRNEALVGEQNRYTSAREKRLLVGVSGFENGEGG